MVVADELVFHTLPCFFHPPSPFSHSNSQCCLYPLRLSPPRMLSLLQLSLQVPAAQSPEHLLSSYHRAITQYNTHSPWSLFPANAQVAHSPAGSYPASAWDHTCREVLRVVEGVLSSDEVLLHLSAASAVAAGAGAGAVDPYEKEGEGGIRLMKQHLTALRNDVIDLINPFRQ